MAKIDRRRKPHVIGILLKSQAEHTDRLIFENPKRIDDPLDEAIHLIGIDALDFLE